MNRPSDVVKKVGLKSLTELSKMSGESTQTLNNWFKNAPRRFELVLKGVMFEQTLTVMDEVQKNIENL